MPQDPPHSFLFYVENLDSGGKTALITGGEHHHLAKVLRIAIGEQIIITNGRGEIFRCHVQEKSTRWTRVELVGQEQVFSSNRSITLALGCIKKDRFERAVEQCTELGVTCFIPFTSQKSHLKAYNEAFINRLRRIALSSMKQSLRATLPVVKNTISFEELFPVMEESNCTIVGEKGAPSLGNPPRRASILIIIGPEGGLTGEERDRLGRHGCVFASTANSRLRSETAAVVLASIVLSTLD